VTGYQSASGNDQNQQMHVHMPYNFNQTLMKEENRINQTKAREDAKRKEPKQAKTPLYMRRPKFNMGIVAN
jgi:hypothetical protein